MKIRRQLLAWAGFLVLAGVFLLLKNLGVFGQWGDIAWGGVFAVVGLGFLVWFLFGLQQWWRAIPGFTLLSIGALLLLTWRGVDLGHWRAALVLFGIALGFWAVVLVHASNWWATIPAGTLTLLGVLIGLQARLSEAIWMAVLFAGMGGVFLLVYLMRLRQNDARWAAIPGAALLLLGTVTLVTAIAAAPVIVQWWPVLLLVAGLGLALGAAGRRAPAAPSRPEPDYAAMPAAKGASVTQALPDAAVPVEPKPTTSVAPADSAKSKPAEGTGAAAAEGKVDIYSVLAQQPPDLAPPAPAAPPKPNTNEP